MGSAVAKGGGAAAVVVTIILVPILNKAGKIIGYTPEKTNAPKTIVAAEKTWVCGKPGTVPTIIAVPGKDRTRYKVVCVPAKVKAKGK